MVTPLAETEHDIEDRLDTHEVGKRLLTIDGIGPQPVARIIAGSAIQPVSPGRGVRGLCRRGAGPRQSGKRARSAPPSRHSAMRACAWRCGCRCRRGAPQPRPARLLRTTARRRQAGQARPIAAMRKLMDAIYSVAKNRGHQRPRHWLNQPTARWFDQGDVVSFRTASAELVARSEGQGGPKGTAKGGAQRP